MPRSASEMENWHKHRGKGTVFAGVLVFVIGLMYYYQTSAPLAVMVVGLLLVLFGLFRTMK